MDAQIFKASGSSVPEAAVGDLTLPAMTGL